MNQWAVADPGFPQGGGNCEGVAGYVLITISRKLQVIEEHFIHYGPLRCATGGGLISSKF